MKSIMKISKIILLVFSVSILLSLAGCQDISVSSVQDNTIASVTGTPANTSQDAPIKPAETDETMQDYSKLFDLKLYSDKTTSGLINDSTGQTPEVTLPSAGTVATLNTPVDLDLIRLNWANESFVVTDGAWVYFPNWKDGHSLYKTKPDGSESIKLNNDDTTWLNFKDGWVYYSCFSAGPVSSGIGIYKIKTDGTDKTRLSSDNAMNLVLEGDWIYYKEFDPMDKGEIYRMKLDGSECQKLNDIDSWYPVISNDWIYYSGNMSKFYKMKLDGSENTIISKSAAEHINVVGDWIYFSCPYSRGQIYKSRLDGTEKTKISTARTNYGMLVLRDWIYYIYTADKKLYKIRTDGTKNTKVISDGLLMDINYLDGWIYYREMEPPYLLYQSKLDGTDRRKVE